MILVQYFFGEGYNYSFIILINSTLCNLAFKWPQEWHIKK
jgi:hypothetical protein